MISSSNTNEGDQNFFRNIKLVRATFWLLIPIFKVVCTVKIYLTDCFLTGLHPKGLTTKKVDTSFA